MLRKSISLAAVLLLLTSCALQSATESLMGEQPQLEAKTTSGDMLKNIPPASEPVALAVYNFEDKTGQNKPSDDFPEYSRAVTQGGAAILSKALFDAGNGGWFTVLEREGLNNLAQERKIIRATREEYRMADGSMLPDIGPMMYAGILVEGAIVAYESDTITGGLGARYLGIGANTKYRRDVVTVALRAVSVKTGQVLIAVNTTKTIFLSSIDANTYRYTTLDHILQIDSGYTVNEPPQFAVKQAIELAVYSMIMEGAYKNYWEFADTAKGSVLVADYISKRDGKGTFGASSETVKKAKAASFYNSSEIKTPGVVNVPAPPPIPDMVAPGARQERPSPTVDSNLGSYQTPNIITEPEAQAPVTQLPESAKQKSPEAGKALEEKIVDTNSQEEFRERLKEEILRSVQTGKVVCGVNGCEPTDQPPVAK